MLTNESSLDPTALISVGIAWYVPLTYGILSDAHLSLGVSCASLDKVCNKKLTNRISGLDSRYMISRLKPPNVKVVTLTTIATPHRGIVVPVSTLEHR